MSSMCRNGEMVYRRAVRITQAASRHLALQGYRREFRRDLCNAGARRGMSIAARAYRHELDESTFEDRGGGYVTSCWRRARPNPERQEGRGSGGCVSSGGRVRRRATGGRSGRTEASAPRPASKRGVTGGAGRDRRARSSAGNAGSLRPFRAELRCTREPAHHEVTLPRVRLFRSTLRTTVASDTSHVEDRVTAALRQPVAVRGVEVLPTGTRLLGHVTAADRSARVKGRARVGFRFTSLDLPGDGGQTPSALRPSSGWRRRRRRKMR